MPKEEKWYASGRGVFRRGAGFQLATMPVTVNWQEDAARFVELLNKGEEYDAFVEGARRRVEELMAQLNVAHANKPELLGEDQEMTRDDVHEMIEAARSDRRRMTPPPMAEDLVELTQSQIVDLVEWGIAVGRQERAAAGIDAPVPAPIPIRLECPSCGALHIDEGIFATKPHHTHACQHCGTVWRPAVLPTVGVRFLPGFKNGGQ